jgi:hypothetical protein
MRTWQQHLLPIQRHGKGCQIDLRIGDSGPLVPPKEKGNSSSLSKVKGNHSTVVPRSRCNKEYWSQHVDTVEEKDIGRQNVQIDRKATPQWDQPAHQQP